MTQATQGCVHTKARGQDRTFNRDPLARNLIAKAFRVILVASRRRVGISVVRDDVSKDAINQCRVSKARCFQFYRWMIGVEC